MIDKSLAALPRRKTDNAIIVRAQDNETDKARVFKLNAKPGEAVLLERYGQHTLLSHISPSPRRYFCRQGGYERQFRFYCPRCTLPVAYQSTPPPVKSGAFVYICAGALTQKQGHLPPDAFDGENGIVAS